MIHPKVEEAFQEIDAAMFSGDCFHYLDSRERLTYFLKRWQKGLDELVTELEELHSDPEVVGADAWQESILEADDRNRKTRSPNFDAITQEHKDLVESVRQPSVKDFTEIVPSPAVDGKFVLQLRLVGIKYVVAWSIPLEEAKRRERAIHQMMIEYHTKRNSWIVQSVKEMKDCLAEMSANNKRSQEIVQQMVVLKT